MVAALAPVIPPEQLAQGRQDSNLQPAVLETAALPIAPLPYGSQTDQRCRVPQASLRRTPSSCFQHRRTSLRNNCVHVEPAPFRTCRADTSVSAALTLAVTFATGTPEDPLNSIE